MTTSTFADTGLRPELLDCLTELGYEEPTPIQSEAIPPLLAGRDVLGQAATGTGKTAAFALPLLHNLPATRGTAPVGLILVPTRELAVQVSEATHRYGKGIGARVLPVYGGSPIGRQLRELERGVDLVIATPGRAVDLISRGALDLGSLQTVVLDEADEMLDMGFADELETILQATPRERQTVLFSATMAPRVEKVARSHMKDPVRVQIERPQAPAGESPQIRQVAYIVNRPQKSAALGRILDLEAPAAAIVFCRTREEVDSLTESLNGRGYRAEALHGGMSQEQRDKVMNRVRSGTAELLVATDVAARGLDIDLLTHVINYNVPSAPDSYTHRIGRVGRAGRAGTAITLAEPREHRMLKTIERVSRSRIAVEKVPTVADLQSRRIELTQASLRESLLQDGFDTYRPIVESLSDEFDVMEIALAAVKLLHEATTTTIDEEEITQVATPRDEPWSDKSRSGHSNSGNFKSGPASTGFSKGGKSKPRSINGTKLYIGMGRSAGMRPQDLVGAIAGETQLTGRDIGGVEIFDKFSLVEVPSASVDEVIAALGATNLRGKRVRVRRER